MRRAGVFGYTLPPRGNAAVQPANFAIFGIIGRFARGLVSVIDVNNITDVDLKTGSYKLGYYGRYVLNTLFTNVGGQSVKGYIKCFVASNAVQAFSTLNDQLAAATLSIKAAFQTIDDKSADGNQTGYTLINGARFTTTINANASIGATVLTFASVAGLRVGDVLKITSAGPVTHYTKISAINEGLKQATVTAITNAVLVGETVIAMGFQITTYRKDIRGVTNKVSLPENTIWLSMEPENVEFYVNNAFVNNPYTKLVDQVSVSTPPQNRWPSDVTTVTFLASGSDGTSPTTASDWSLYTAFDNYPVRFLFNSDTTLTGVNIDGEAYCHSRLDRPTWASAVTKKQSKSQLITIGQGYQRGDEVNSVVISSFRNVNDPIGVGANPVLAVPCHGAVIGAWIFSIFTRGIHQIPAGADTPLIGFVDTSDATEDTFTDDDRTDLLGAGINLIQFKQGLGLILSNLITPSTTVANLDANHLVMTGFIKISIVESLANAENRPNRITALIKDADLVRSFGQKLFDGSFPFGIDPAGAFGNFIKQDGSVSTFEDVFQVQADQFNNPTSNILIGQGDLFVFYFPPPILKSYAIGVGVLIPLG